MMAVEKVTLNGAFIRPTDDLYYAQQGWGNTPEQPWWTQYNLGNNNTTPTTTVSAYSAANTVPLSGDFLIGNVLKQGWASLVANPRKTTDEATAEIKAPEGALAENPLEKNKTPKEPTAKPETMVAAPSSSPSAVITPTVPATTVIPQPTTTPLTTTMPTVATTPMTTPIQPIQQQPTTVLPTTTMPTVGLPNATMLPTTNTVGMLPQNSGLMPATQQPPLPTTTGIEAIMRQLDELKQTNEALALLLAEQSKKLDAVLAEKKMATANDAKKTTDDKNKTMEPKAKKPSG